MNRRSISKIWAIARHEFIAIVTRASYLLVTLGVPLFLRGTVYVSAMSGRSSTRK